ncbi:MAG: hypothetical protein ACC663_01805, partial [Gammaproteobacteria bacterium]
MKTMKITRHRQKGLSGVGWLALAGIFGLLIVSGIRVFPLFLENYTIKTVLTSVQGDARVDPKSRRAIWD